MADSQAVLMAKAVSRLCGWLYFLAWSLSFYPQVIMNWQRKSTHGFSIDFPVCNILGFAAYTTTTATFLFSDTVRSQYAFRHPVSPEPSVQPNDFAFAAHGLLMCLVVYSQFWASLWGFQVGLRQRASRAVLGIFWGCISGVFCVLLLVWRTSPDGGFDPKAFAWIDIIYALGYVKLIVTVVKYVPQIVLNYQRKSTVGWSIIQILCDISGGVLSIIQLVIDSSLQNDWSGLTGNPAKLGLGNITIIFDVIFLVQHYVLYRRPSDAQPEDEDEQGLLIRPHSEP